MAEFVANFNLNNNNLDASFDLSEGASFDALFEIYAGSVTWGNILGDITNQTDLYNILMSKADKTTVEADLEAINDTIAENYETLDNKIDSVQSDLSGDISDLQTTVSDNYSELNTKIQNETTARAENDSLLQGDINTLSDDLTTEISNRESADSGLQTQITNLTGTVSSNYNTLNNSISNLSDTVNDLSDTVDSNYNILDTKIDTTRTTLQGNIDTLSGTVTSNYNDLTQSITNNVSTLNTRITNEVSTLNGAISNEATARANADNNLQTQIDAIVSSSDVFDIVGTYTELQAYNISTVPVNDIIKVLVDSTHNNAATYYRCVENNGVKSWSYIGSEGAYYTKGEADSTFVPQIRTINNKALNQNINLTASDVGALPVGTQIGNGTILLTQGGVQKGTFTLNQTGNATIDFDAVSEDITVDSELSTTSTNPVQNKIITGALNDKQDMLTAGTDLEIVSVGSQGLPNGYTLLEWVESNGLQSLSLGFSGNCTIEFTTQMAHVPTSNEVLLTSSTGASAGTWFGVNSDNTWSYSEISGSIKIDVVMNATAQGLNGTINSNTFSRNVPVTHGTWTLFSNIPTSGTTTFPSFMKLFALKVTQNSAVIRNLIPCKNNNNVAGLYDTINGVFYSSTSGTQLIAGTVIPTGKVINFTNESGYTKNRGTVTSVNGVQPDSNGNVTLVTGGVTDVEVNGESVVTDGVAEIDLTGYQEKLTAGTDLEIVEGSTLPAGYVQLKSITSTTTQYINTKISMTANYKAVIVGRLTQQPTANFSSILGADNQNNNPNTQGKYNVILGWGNASNGFYTENCIPSGAIVDYTYSSYPWDTETHTFTVTVTPTQTTLKIDGVINTISLPPAAWDTPTPLYLFTRNTAANGRIGSITPFELEKIEQYQNGVLVFNGIPCKLGDIVGLYNTVTNEFLPNSGTGAFVEGDAIPNETIINFTNTSGYIKGINSSDVTTALGYTPYNSTNPNGYITSSALNGYATQTWVGQQGYLTGITSAQVTTALGYTPYDATNPNGYTSNVGTVTSVNGIQPDGSGNVAITIPTVNNGTLTITQDGNTLGTFGANQSGNTTVDIPPSSNRNIGEIVTSTIPLTDAGLHLLDGSLISGSGSYSAFVDYIAGLVTDYPDLFDTEANWQSAVTQYGVCGKFVYTQPTYQLIDTSSGTTGWYTHSLEVGSQVYATNGTPQITIASVSGNHITVTGAQAALFPSGFDRDTANDVSASVRLPKITGLVEGTTDLTALGDLVQAGLPNITGYADSNYLVTKTDSNGGAMSYFADARPYYGSTQSTVTSFTHGISFDASNSNSIYGNSTTVQPQTIKVLYYIVIATSTKTNIEVDIDEIATDLNGKADTDLSNLTSTGEKHFLNKKQITNCILETPSNWMTYSGSQVTIKAGTKYLVPNGRNADGTLNNAEVTLQSDIVYTNPAQYNGRICVVGLADGNIWSWGNVATMGCYRNSSEFPTPAGGFYWLAFSEEDNRWYITADGAAYTQSFVCPLGTARVTTNGSILSINPFKPTHLLTMGNREEISGWSMPGTSYTNLSLGASGTSYTAPADGYFVLGKVSGIVNGTITLTNNRRTGINSQDGTMTVRYTSPTTTITLYGYIPAHKGDVVQVRYTATGKTTHFMFVYAYGSESEAN